MMHLMRVMLFSRFVLTLVQSDWDIFSPEDVFVKRGLKARIRNAIVKVINSMLNMSSSIDEERFQEAEEEGEESHKDTSEVNNDTDLHFISSPTNNAHSHWDSIDNTARLCNRETQPAVRRNCIPNMLFPIETYRLLDDRGWLPESHRSFRLVYE